MPGRALAPPSHPSAHRLSTSTVPLAAWAQHGLGRQSLTSFTVSFCLFVLSLCHTEARHLARAVLVTRKTVCASPAQDKASRVHVGYNLLGSLPITSRSSRKLYNSKKAAYDYPGVIETSFQGQGEK